MMIIKSRHITQLHRDVRYIRDAELINIEANSHIPDIHIENHNGNTPLHVTASDRPYWWRDSTISLIKKLINAGADINAKNDDGKTPYDLCNSKLKDDPKIIALLKPSS